MQSELHESRWHDLERTSIVSGRLRGALTAVGTHARGGYISGVSDAPPPSHGAIYREPAPGPLKAPDPYLATWARMRRRRPVGWAGVALLFVGVPVLVWLGSPAVLPALGLSVLLALQLDPGACPRCGKPFGSGFYNNAFTSRCLHCGIERGTPGPS